MNGVIVNLVTNLGALGILAVLVVWLGPRMMARWQEMYQQDLATRNAIADRVLETMRLEMRYEREQCQAQFKEFAGIMRDALVSRSAPNQPERGGP